MKLDVVASCRQAEIYTDGIIQWTIKNAAEEIERLRDSVAELQAECGYTDSIKTLEIERLREALKTLWVAFQDNDAFRRVYASVTSQQHGKQER